MSNTKKTAAKRMGIKSALAYGKGKVAITSFGRGNEANIAFKSPDAGRGTICPHRASAFTITKIDEMIDVERGTLASVLNNPAENVQEDYLGLKGTLEKEFFDGEFSGDTSRIQIIHNILDIFKILGVYVNDIVYTISNLQDIPMDQLGQSLSGEKKKEILKKMSPYFGFFGDAFRIPPKKCSQEELDACDNHNYTVLQILSHLRNTTAHWKEKISEARTFTASDEIVKHFDAEQWKIIASMYKKRIDQINRDFLSHSSMNLDTLFKMFNAETDEAKKKIVCDYYQFAIVKTGKNLGVNLTKIREKMVKKFAPDILTEKNVDSFRSKVYAITDFVIFQSVNDSKPLDAMVSKLRETSDDEAKEKIYDQFALEVWNRTKNLLEPFFNRVVQGFTKANFKKDGNISPDWLNGTALDSSHEIPLLQYLSFLCNFLEGKEINELLTSYIHKFENIQSLIDTLKELGESVTFTEKYRAFNEEGDQFAQKMADQLRILASLGKMKPDLDGAKRLLYKSAITMLGIPDDSEYVSDPWLDNNIVLSPNASDYEKRKTSINPFRNFIAKNVIGSRRFLYLVRYTKPETVRALMKNPKIVRYVLTRLPENQIGRYIQTVTGKESDGLMANQIQTLTQRLTEFSFEFVLDQKGKICDNARKRGGSDEVERLKALTGLYLTVAYVAIKNLVKVNARYFIAFAAWDRDYHFMKASHGKEVTQYGIPYEYDRKDNNGKMTVEKGKNQYLSLTRYYLDQDKQKDFPSDHFDREKFKEHLKTVKRHFKKKWREIFTKEIQETLQFQGTGALLTQARNDAEHLNVLNDLQTYVKDFRARVGQPMQSYFELYHYILQRRLMKEAEETNKAYQERQASSESAGAEIVPYQFPAGYQMFIKMGIPCEDLIKLCYVSLGYNLPRYKNLTTEALFDEDSVSGRSRSERLQSKRKKLK